MTGIRERLNNAPWAGWTLAGVLLCVAVYVYFSRSSSAVAYDPDQMKQEVTVKFADTGEEVVMPRGKFERQLREANRGTLDPTRGLINPKTQAPTGFLFNKAEWDATIARINKERKEAGTDSDTSAVGGRTDAPVAPLSEGAGSPASNPSPK